MGAGCESCSENLTAELNSKSEEDLTESEKEALESGEMPFAYGPLSDWDGAFCEFCHNIGQVMSLLTGVFAFTLASDSMGTAGALGLALAIGGPLSMTVGYLGRFPIFGALFGPLVETGAAQFGIYVTEKARQEYSQGGQAMADGGRPGVNNFARDGTEMHLVATDYAVEYCLSPQDPGAVKMVEVDNGQIVDVHPAPPNMHFNRFRNIKDHVGLSKNTVCDGGLEDVITMMQFSELIQSGGSGGIE